MSCLVEQLGRCPRLFHLKNPDQPVLFLSRTTVTTVGYGDITSQNDDEKMFTMFSMIVGGAFYGDLDADWSASLVRDPRA